MLSTSFLDYELPLFGGFYHGEKYNYIVFGQKNTELDDSLEVLRAVQYDHDFRKTGSAGVSDVYTKTPFDAGNLRMAESDDLLVVHTSRLRYDGHQSQLTVIFRTDPFRLDTQAMEQLRGHYASHEFQINHVCHSFNQFVRFDCDDIVLIDHGDAYGRGIQFSVLGNSSRGRYLSSKTLLLQVPGKSGANQTGISIGGFEISSSSYLVTYSAIDADRVSEYSSFYMYDGNGSVIYESQQERDAVILAAPRTDPADTSVIKLTDYTGTGKCASAPYLCGMGSDRYLVLWERFACSEGVISPYCEGVCALVVDGMGNALSPESFTPECRLSRDCQPVIYNNIAVWFVDGPAFDIDIPMRSVYWLDVSGYADAPAEYYTVPGAVNTDGDVSFRALLCGQDLKGYLMAAAFDRSGRQISAICLPASRWNDVSLPDSAGAAEAVLFRTDDSFRPLCAPEKIIL